MLLLAVAWVFWGPFCTRAPAPCLWVQHPAPSTRAVRSQMLNQRVWMEIMKTWACCGVLLRNPPKEQDHAVSKSVIWAG